MKTKLIVLLIFFLPALIYAQSIYSIASIPDSLKENANVVYILDEGIFEIKDDDRAIFKVKQVIAILNSKGKHHAMEGVVYDKLIKVNSFSGNVYSAYGKLIKKTKKSDIKDQSSISGFSIYEDNRIKTIDLQQTSYPYIVEFEYEVEYKYLYSIPDWWAINGENISTVKSTYAIIVPQEYKPRVRMINSGQKLIETVEAGLVTISATFENITAIEREPYGPNFEELVSHVEAAPSKFNFEGYEGDMSTWESYGKWQTALNKGRTELPSETIEEIKRVVAQYDTKEEKVKAVYEYMQNKTRYVSIQEGIGGLQPFPAKTVDKLGYGDCKALSNYTQSLLQAIGIESHYTKVFAGKNPRPLSVEFTNHFSNHIILCVPNELDTIWLECTNQTNPFGYMGTFTGDRDVMLVTDDGGKIVHTPVYKKEVNTQFTHVEVTLNKEGSAQASFKIEYAGLKYENNGLDFLINESDTEQKKWIYKHTDIPDFTIKTFDFMQKKERIPSITETVSVDVPRLSAMNGKRMFIAPNLLNKWSYTPPRVKDRQTDVILKREYIDVDTVIYLIPEELHIEYLPETIEINTEFGTYKAGFSFKDHQLIYTRKVEINKGRFPKESYDSFRQFRKDIIKADNQKVVFLNKT